MDNVSPVTCNIVITGPFSTGQTTFIKAISELDLLSDNQDAMTVTMDIGRITTEDQSLDLYLFGTPGGRRFDMTWEILGAGMLGFIVMVDSRSPETFREVRWIARIFASYAPVPYLFAANFQDVPDAWDIEALRIALQVPNDIPIIPCVATDRESVKGVIIALLNEVLKDIEQS